MTGFIINPRGLWDADVFADEPFTEREAYLWLREQANFKDGFKRHGSKLYPIKRGQYPCTILGLSQKFQWSRGKVRRFLEILKNGHLADIKTDTPFITITICNYDVNSEAEKQNGHLADTKTDTSRTPRGHTINKEKKENNKINIPPLPPKGETKTKIQKFVLPDWIPKQDWDDWVEMRKVKKRPLTDAAKLAAIRKLEALKVQGNDPSEVLKQSVFNSWQGLFKLKDSEDFGEKPLKKETPDEILAKARKKHGFDDYTTPN